MSFLNLYSSARKSGWGCIRLQVGEGNAVFWLYVAPKCVCAFSMQIVFVRDSTILSVNLFNSFFLDLVVWLAAVVLPAASECFGNEWGVC